MTERHYAIGLELELEACDQCGGLEDVSEYGFARCGFQPDGSWGPVEAYTEQLCDSCARAAGRRSL